jgi:IPT/TIG domain
MLKRFLACAVASHLVIVAGVSLGCDRSSPVTTQPTSPTPLPVVAASGPPPSVTSVSPEIGSTGGTSVRITGIGFRSGASVTLGGLMIRGCSQPTENCSWVEASTTIYAFAPAHAAGSVDVVVTNPDGQAGGLAGGYTYAIPESFEANGTWEGGADSNYGTPFRFTVQNDTLTSISCGVSGTLTLSPPPPISHGEFSFVGPDGASVSGRIVSPNWALGKINMSPCFAFPWSATRQ